MKFKLDENLPLEIADALRDAGHKADTVHSEGLAGASDLKILAAVQIENQILLTMDKGIADIRAFPPSQYPGIVLFRPSSTGRGEVLRFVQQALPDLLSVNLAGHLVIVSPRACEFDRVIPKPSTASPNAYAPLRGPSKILLLCRDDDRVWFALRWVCRVPGCGRFNYWFRDLERPKSDEWEHFKYFCQELLLSALSASLRAGSRRCRGGSEQLARCNS